MEIVRCEHARIYKPTCCATTQLLSREELRYYNNAHLVRLVYIIILVRNNNVVTAVVPHNVIERPHYSSIQPVAWTTQLCTLMIARSACCTSKTPRVPKTGGRHVRIFHNLCKLSLFTVERRRECRRRGERRDRINSDR